MAKDPRAVVSGFNVAITIEFLSWDTAARVLEDAGELGVVTTSEEGLVDDGFCTIIRNSLGEPLLNISTLDGKMKMRTHLGNIRKILVL